MLCAGGIGKGTSWVSLLLLGPFSTESLRKNVCMLIAEYDCHDISIMHIVAMSMSSQKYF